jgi:hypothetical protein
MNPCHLLASRSWIPEDEIGNVFTKSEGLVTLTSIYTLGYPWLPRARPAPGFALAHVNARTFEHGGGWLNLVRVQEAWPGAWGCFLPDINLLW